MGTVLVLVFEADGSTFVNTDGATMDILGGNIKGDGMKSGLNIGIPAATWP